MVTCRPYSQETLAQDAHTLPWGLTQQVIDDEVDAVFESKKKKKKKTKEVSPDMDHAHPNGCASRLYKEDMPGDGSLHPHVHCVGPSQSMIVC